MFLNNDLQTFHVTNDCSERILFVSRGVSSVLSLLLNFCKLSSVLLFVGHVTWDEYRVKFLASKGFNEKEVAEKLKNNEELKVDEESKSAPILSLWCLK